LLSRYTGAPERRGISVRVGVSGDPPALRMNYACRCASQEEQDNDKSKLSKLPFTRNLSNLSKCLNAEMRELEKRMDTKMPKWASLCLLLVRKEIDPIQQDVCQQGNHLQQLEKKLDQVLLALEKNLLRQTV
jgi:hypothetical protein